MASIYTTGGCSLFEPSMSSSTPASRFSLLSIKYRTRSRIRISTIAKDSTRNQSSPAPPKPNRKFSRQDLKRIKQQGPSIDDLQVHIEVENQEKNGEKAKVTYDFVPTDVLGTLDAAPEPKWHTMPEMPYMKFYQGLRERNWTSKYYNPDAEPWSLQFVTDSGRFMRSSFAGYRVVVTTPDGKQSWVKLELPGADTFLRDYSGGGGSAGAIFRAKRTPQTLYTPAQYGYNQVFEQLFQAHEQRLPQSAKKEINTMGWSRSATGDAYDCPADRHFTDITFTKTPNEFSLHSFWETLPSVIFYGFGVSFLGIALAIGIFRPRKQMPTDMFQAMEFAQSKGNARKDGSTGVKFADVGGLGSTIGDMMEVVEFLKAPQRYSTLEAKPPKGILLSGDPGVGKTLIAKAIAGEAGVPFYQMAGSEFVEAIVGVGAARVRDLFKRARVQAPCIIFVDEIDALGIRRADAGVETNEEREQTLNQLLSEMDGFKPDQGVVFVAATNRPDLLDPALVRAGRFDRKIVIRRPDEVGREEILNIHARRHILRDDVNLKQLAKDLPGLSGAELGNVMNEAALEAVRRDGNEIIPQDVYNAVDRVLQGLRRPPLPDRFNIRRAIAVHEAGTAIVATVLYKEHGRIEAVERVSTIPRGKDWSRTVYARGEDEEYLIMTKGRLLDRIRVVLAGRAAEQLSVGVPSTYSLSDIRDATRLAIRLVANYGLDASVGIPSYAPPPPGQLGAMKKSFEVTVDNIDADLFGASMPVGSFQPSDDSWHEIRSTAAQIVKDAYAANLDDLERRKMALDVTTEILLEKETMLGDELEEIMNRYPAADATDHDQTSSGGGNGSRSLSLSGSSSRIVNAALERTLTLDAEQTPSSLVSSSSSLYSATSRNGNGNGSLSNNGNGNGSSTTLEKPIVENMSDIIDTNDDGNDTVSVKATVGSSSGGDDLLNGIDL